MDDDTRALVEAADRLTRHARKGARFREGLRLYERAFKQGSHIAGYNLAVSYQAIGDYKRAVAWFRRVLKAGDRSALEPLAHAELHGVGTKRDVRAALKKLEIITRGGDGITPFAREQAMVTLAALLREGWVVRRDYAASIRWLRRAAKIGSKEARGLLADLTI